jgi:hypothetical protein
MASEGCQPSSVPVLSPRCVCAYKKQELRTANAAFALFKPFIMTADLIVLHTGDALFGHGTVVPDPVFRELAPFLDQDIQHHPQQGDAKEDQAYD